MIFLCLNANLCAKFDMKSGLSLGIILFLLFQVYANLKVLCWY